jgi:hypothetical protein
MNRLAKPLSIVFVVLSFYAIRLFVLPGLSFNQSVWDDEIGWINDSNNKSVGEYISYRDAPGYFVFVPRILILLGNLVPSIDSISSLRLIVFTVQILCFAAAAACVASFRRDSKFFVFLYFSLLMTYVEDLNYVHNIGYIFIFPIFYLVFSKIIEGEAVPLWRFGLAAILISKPFTAVIVIGLVALFVWQRTNQTRKLLLFGSYGLAYLGTYMLLPNRWETPFNSDPMTIAKAVVNFPWVVFSTLNPLIAIGGLGFSRLLGIELSSIIIGCLVYISSAIALFSYRSKIFFQIQKFSLLTKSLFLVFLTNYLLVFSASDSFWVKYFPLFRLDSPQFIWARWSSVIPLSSLLIIASLGFIAPRVRIMIFSYVTIQWVILLSAANPWLRRYW